MEQERREDRYIGLEDGSRLALSAAEWVLFSQLFQILDSDCDGLIGGTEGAAFLRRANLSDHILREVWRVACGGRSKPALSKEEWMMACKLVASAQSFSPPSVDQSDDPNKKANDGEENIADIMNVERLKRVKQLPDFGLRDRQADYKSEARAGWLPASDVEIHVSNPTAVGSGMGRHVDYTVKTTTSLPHFQRAKAEVTRRYSDFRWMHRRLQARYPGTAIPPLPEKKLFGNLTARFVEERRLGMEQYLNHVARHPKLSKHLDVQVFLDATPEGLELYKGLVDAVPSGTAGQGNGSGEAGFPVGEPGDGSNAMENASGTFSSPTTTSSSSSASNPSSVASATGSWLSKVWKKVENSAIFGVAEELASFGQNDAHIRRELSRLGISQEQILAFRSQIDDYSKRLGAVTQVAEKIISCRRAQGYELARIGAYISSISKLETSFFPAANAVDGGDVYDTVEYKTSDFLNQIAAQFDQVSNHIQDLNDRGTSELVAPLRFQQGKLDSIKTLLDNHDACVRSLKQAHESLASAKKRYASARAQNGLVDAAQSNIKQAESRIKQAEETLLEMDKSLRSEYQAFLNDKAIDLRSIFHDLVNAEAQGSSDIQQMLLSAVHISSDGSSQTLLDASATRRSQNTLDAFENLPIWFTRKATLFANQQNQQHE